MNLDLMHGRSLWFPEYELSKLEPLKVLCILTIVTVMLDCFVYVLKNAAVSEKVMIPGGGMFSDENHHSLLFVLYPDKPA